MSQMRQPENAAGDGGVLCQNFAKKLTRDQTGRRKVLLVVRGSDPNKPDRPGTRAPASSRPRAAAQWRRMVEAWVS